MYLIFSCVVLSSCSNENLYEFKDLTSETDFIYHVRAYAEDSTKVIDYKVTVYETNGYNQLISYPYGTTSARNKIFHATEYSVKGYKENGILFTPRDNIRKIWIDCYEVGETGANRYTLFQHITEEIAPIYVGYNFETGEKIVEYREE